MMQHHKTEKITFRGRELVVNEITVAQVDEWEAALGQGGGVEPHKLDQLMGKSLPVSGLRLCVPDLTDEDLLVAPSEIEKVYDAVEKVNPFFLGTSRTWRASEKNSWRQAQIRKRNNRYSLSVGRSWACQCVFIRHEFV